MRSKRARRIEDLRRAVDCLPERTKAAMLEGIAANTIIVGAYTDRRGGVCPMLAAHRHGGRTNLLAFAHAWDRFCDAKRPRPAIERELVVLKAHLEASLLGTSRSDLSAAIADHQAAARDRRAREARQVGLGWLRRRDTEPEVAERDDELVGV
jgi:hypothetical protein